jgi:hypothetical protein
MNYEMAEKLFNKTHNIGNRSIDEKQTQKVMSGMWCIWGKRHEICFVLKVIGKRCFEAASIVFPPLVLL